MTSPPFPPSPGAGKGHTSCWPSGHHLPKQAATPLRADSPALWRKLPKHPSLPSTLPQDTEVLLGGARDRGAEAQARPAAQWQSWPRALLQGGRRLSPGLPTPSQPARHVPVNSRLTTEESLGLSASAPSPRADEAGEECPPALAERLLLWAFWERAHRICFARALPPRRLGCSSSLADLTLRDKEPVASAAHTQEIRSLLWP